MKNKTKKNKGDKFFVLQIILIALFLVSLIWAIVRNVNQEPHFKIDEEVCRNETFYYGYSEQTNYSKEIKCYDSKEKEIKDLICYGKDLVFASYTSEVCEQVEVEEIFLGKCKEGFEQADEPSGLSKDILICHQESCEYIEEIDWSFCSSIYDFIVIQRISKQDLTRDLLDENCEIQKGECLKWGRRNSEGIAICKNELKKYSCREKYIVEVWNQVK